LKVFGLETTKTTMVGNEFIQGVSGGERKRVSIAEIAVGPSLCNLGTILKFTLVQGTPRSVYGTTVPKA